MSIKQIWLDGNKDWSFMRVALTPSILACVFGIIYGAIKLDPATIGASVAGITGMLFAKATQAKYELTKDETPTK